MLFLLRAAVVIGGLSYLALLRDRPDTMPVPAVPPAQALALQAVPAQTLAAAWDAVPAEARERIVREGADALGRRLGTHPATSADTLAQADRQPPWRGVAAR